MLRIRCRFAFKLRSRRQLVLINRLPKFARILDVGCGNNSPRFTKHIRPDAYYIGLDVSDYNQMGGSIGVADQYLISTSSGFTDSIYANKGECDAVISSHNLEHCDDPIRVLESCCAALKSKGVLYLSFSCEISVKFPRRLGTLNFFNDQTHKSLPKFDDVIQILKDCGMGILYANRRYRPPLFALIGLILEPISVILRRVMPFGFTWAFYGFETIIWANKQVSINREMPISEA